MAEARGDNGGSSKLSPSPKEQGLTSKLLLTAGPPFFLLMHLDRHAIAGSVLALAVQSDGPTGQALIRGLCACASRPEDMRCLGHAWVSQMNCQASVSLAPGQARSTYQGAVRSHAVMQKRAADLGVMRSIACLAPRSP
jgi:hypothetical protein